MKQIRNLLFITMVILFTSCGTYETSSGGGFWGGVSSFIDYGISEWQKVAPPDSYDHTLIDAWQSGTGGKALAIGEVSTAIIGGVTGKDVSGLKNRIHNAARNLTQNESYTKNDVNNWTGALFTLGDEFIDEYNTQKFEDAVKRLTDPNASGYNEEEALRVKSFDYQNKKIIWKSNSEYIYDLIEYRKSKNEDWISSNVGPACNMTLQEYNNLSNEARQQADLKIIAYDKSKNSATEQPKQENENAKLETLPSGLDKKKDFASLIDAVVISDYNINSYALSDIHKESLDRIGEMMNNDPTLELLISGHTCTLGSNDVNYNVGLKRANAAKDYLISKGIDGNRIEIESLGYSNPADDNSTALGRRNNRRLTFKILNK